MSNNRFANVQRLWGQAENGSRIFVSYRRDDARGDAGRLTDNLKLHFGDKQVFRDLEAIEAGVDFVEAINNAVSQCAVLLAIVGPNWLKATDSEVAGGSTIRMILSGWKSPRRCSATFGWCRC
jgi:hypothetical protein